MSGPEFFLAQHTALILYTSKQLQLAQNIYTATKVNASYNEKVPSNIHMDLHKI
jgi:hypothetical protein